MRRLFDMDSPLMGFLMKVCDSLVLSLLWLLFSLPVITLGASSSALYTAVLRCLRRDEAHLWPTFWEAFRENFRRSTLCWLAILALLAMLTVDGVVFRYLLVRGDGLGNLYWLILVLMCIAVTWAAYVFAYCARCRGSVRDVLRISFQLMVLHPLRALGVLFPLLVAFMASLIVPGILLLLPAPVCWCESVSFEAVLRLHMQPEDLEREIENENKQ